MFLILIISSWLFIALAVVIFRLTRKKSYKVGELIAPENAELLPLIQGEARVWQHPDGYKVINITMGSDSNFLTIAGYDFDIVHRKTL